MQINISNGGALAILIVGVLALGFVFAPEQMQGYIAAAQGLIP